MERKKPRASASAWIFVLRPPRERPTACFAPPLSASCRAVSLHVRRVDHLCLYRPSTSGKLPEQVLPDAALRPAHETVIDRRGRTILWRTITPAAAALENMNDPTDHTAVVHPLLASNIRRQMRFNPSPILVAQPKQVLAHDLDPSPKPNQAGMESGLSCLSSKINEFSP